MSLKFRVELVWQDSDASVAESIFLTSDGRVILQGRAVSAAEREALTILHYDGDFDLVASITGQPVAWVVPRGSVS